jgi:hypothetical protein
MQYEINIQQCQFHEETKLYREQMNKQGLKAKRVRFDLFLLLYIDTGSFLFETKQGMAKGASILKRF